MRRPAWLRSPATFRGRIVLATALVLIAAIAGQALVRDIVDRRVARDVRQALQQQAQLIADDVDAAPDARKSARASAAARYLVQTRIVVRWTAKPGLFFNVVPFERRDIEVTVRSGDVEVRLARERDGAGFSKAGIFGLLALASVLAAGVWVLAGSLSRRLSRQSRQLAAVADAVAAGDRSARAPESDDELGRVASAFNEMAGNLQQADARQRRFLADIAHELRTPVTAIQGFAGALIDGAATSAKDRAEAAEFIRDEAQRLHGLVSDLRSLTLLDTDSVPLTREPVDLAEAGDDALQRLRATGDGRGVTLHPPQGEVTTMTDRTHLDTILTNLVANAITATPAGGSVAVTVGVHDGHPWIAVADTGVGISPQDQPRIFDRLYRVDDARSREEGGSGLGLAIVRRLVDLLDARITLESTVGAGSTFTVVFPSADADAGSVQPNQPRIERRIGDRRTNAGPQP